MTAEPAREFVDANVLVYALDASAGRKREVARDLVARLWDAGTGCVSVQVLQELYVTVTRKVSMPLSIDEAAERVRDLTAWTVFAPRAEDVLGAIALQKRAKLGFWDAMIAHAAGELGCEVLWTEDLQDGQLIGGVRVRNPFAAERS